MNLVDKLIERAKRTPYFHITGYMHRYWLIKPNGQKSATERKRWFMPDFGIRIHRILRSDEGQHLHDHPWPSMSIVLRGGYWEIMPRDHKQDPSLDGRHCKIKWRGPGAIVLRRANHRHRLVVPRGHDCWSMFWMGSKRKTWGFYPPEGFVPYKTYLNIPEDAPRPENDRKAA